MYCTGGVRCEKASALIRQGCDAAAASPVDYTELFQLAGGIERYLQLYSSDTAGDALKGGCSTDGSFVQDAERREAGVCGGKPIAGATSGAALVHGDLICERQGGDGEDGFFRGKNFVFDER